VEGLAEWVARVEALRERGRGLAALLTEKRRGLERELATAADTGVVETLVADAVTLRNDLAALDAAELTLPGTEALDAAATAEDTHTPPRSAGAPPKGTPPAPAPAPTRSSASGAPRAPRPRSASSTRSAASWAPSSTTSRSSREPRPP